MAVSRRTVTVLFADIADWTPLGERLDPESLRQVMTRYFDAMGAVLESHGGTLEKFIGDAVMAVFGIPELHEDDALRAVRAATDLRLALAGLNEELEQQLGVRIGIRVGVNTGEVVAGDGTGGQRLVTGDPVTTAKRLEESARTGEILVGETTRRLVENAVVLEPRDPLTLKGKSDPVVAWNALAIVEGASAYARRLDAPLVGRERELRMLRETFDAAMSDRACRLVTVVGPAGIGKSRLTAELCRAVGRRRACARRALPSLRRRDHVLAARSDRGRRSAATTEFAKCSRVPRTRTSSPIVCWAPSARLRPSRRAARCSGQCAVCSRSSLASSRSSSWSRTSTGRSRSCSICSSTSRAGPTTRRSSFSASRVPSCSTSDQAG